MPRLSKLLVCGLGLLLIIASSLDVALAVEPEAGFKSIFDGKTLDGWIGATDGYFVRDGAIVCNPKIGGNLFTAKEYANFVLRFETKIPASGNSGIAVRSPNEKGSLVLKGTEIQILDDYAEIHKTIKPYQFHGSVYGVVAAKQGAVKSIGEWNEHEITFDGRRAKVVVNGKTVVDADLDAAVKNGTLDGKEHPGLDRASGHLGFLGHGTAVEFRNLRVKELPASK